MSTTIEIVQLSSDKLRKRKYQFIMLRDNMEFVLNSYVLTVRESKRHGFKMKEIYNRIRYNTTYVGVTEWIEVPPIPKSVVDAFYRKSRAAIQLKDHEDV